MRTIRILGIFRFRILPRLRSRLHEFSPGESRVTRNLIPDAWLPTPPRDWGAIEIFMSWRGNVEEYMRPDLPNPRKDTFPLTRMQDLAESERLIIDIYRRWIAGMRSNDDRHWSVVWTELSGSLGMKSARAILAGLQSVIAGIGSSSRRPVQLHPPCCGFVCPDELLVLNLVGACQRRNYALARSTAEWMVSCDGRASLLEGGRRIADALTERDILLPERMGQNTKSEHASFTAFGADIAKPQLRAIVGGRREAGVA